LCDAPTGTRFQSVIASIKLFYAQGENLNEDEPGGFHLIQLPFADDIRSAPIEDAARGLPTPLVTAYFTRNLSMVIASNPLVEAAESWISKLSLRKDSGYPVDSNPNPGNVLFPHSPCLPQIIPI
jgi:ATP-dependent DNA helicase 2 subunit 1